MNSSDDPDPNAYRRRQSQVASMIAQGRSFSGRERNCCFLNTLADPAAKGRFANVSATSGLDFADDGRAVSVVDWDHDGDLDLWISNRNAPRIRLLRNNTKSGNHFLAVRLAGNGKTTSRDAIGARVEVTTAGADRPQIKTLRAGEGFLAQSSKWLHFGLGAADKIEMVTVRWPGGEQEAFAGLDADGRYRLAQGSGKAVELQQARSDLKIQPSAPKLPPKSSAARIPLVTLFTLPAEKYQDLDDRRQSLPLGRGRSLLINLWSTSCGPCLTELRELARREKEIRAAGVEIVALNVDLLAEDPVDRTAVKALVSELAFPFLAGYTSPQLLNLLQMFHDQIILRKRPLPLPSSFLLDAKGRLTVIYKGPVSVDQLLVDVQHTGDTLLERQQHAALLPGRILKDEILVRSARIEQSQNYTRMAEVLRQVGRIRGEVRHYQEALRIRPDDADAHNNLGNALHQLDRPQESIAHFKEAVRLKPDLARAHYNWGLALQSLEQFAKASAHFQKASQIKPDNAETHNSWGVVLDRLGRFEEAVTHFQEALRIKPDFPEAHNNWGIALAKQGRIQDALTQFKHAVRLKPDYTNGRNNLRRAQLRLQQIRRRAKP
jgi:tetratricopeptide (TPR) repeat protein